MEQLGTAKVKTRMDSVMLKAKEKEIQAAEATNKQLLEKIKSDKEALDKKYADKKKSLKKQADELKKKEDKMQAAHQKKEAQLQAKEEDLQGLFKKLEKTRMPSWYTNRHGFHVVDTTFGKSDLQAFLQSTSDCHSNKNAKIVGMQG